MARYDADWGRPSRGHNLDLPFRPRSTTWGGDQEGFGSRAGVRWRYDQDFGRVPGADGSFSGSMYGPERYGLGPYHERLRKRRRPDDELREEVEEALFYDTWVDAEAISVQVEDGIVTLQGELPSYEEVRYAIDDAWDVDGVIGVRSRLTVRER